jgi:outer membrane protein
MRRRGRGAIAGMVVGVAGVLVLGSVGARAQTLEGALSHAYVNNPTLNAQRAATRSINENVPRALSGYRPTVTANASAGVSSVQLQSPGGLQQKANLVPTSVGVTANQTLYNGLRTGNSVRSAESQVSQARETLRSMEQSVLLGAATAYMNVLRDDALVELQRQNLQALREQLRATRDRFNVGEVTRTDTALAEAAAAGAQSSLIQAQSNLTTSRALYRQAIGEDPPAKLTPGRPIDNMLPKSYEVALGAALRQNPTILAAQYGVDVAELLVRFAEGGLLPTLTAQGSLNRATDVSTLVSEQKIATALLNLTVPIYQGGLEYASVRQAKENVGQARLLVDVSRDQVRASVLQFWGALEAARAGLEAANTQVNAQTIAQNGILEEWKVGQRTILDVLNARAQLVVAQSNLVGAQRDRVVASYSVLSAIGRLDMESLGLRTAVYQPEEHYLQVRDTWLGLRTPGGR